MPKPITRNDLKPGTVFKYVNPNSSTYRASNLTLSGQPDGDYHQEVYPSWGSPVEILWSPLDVPPNMPIPAYWSDGTYVVCEMSDLPVGIHRMASRSTVDSAASVSIPTAGFHYTHQLADVGGGNVYAKVRIEDVMTWQRDQFRPKSVKHAPAAKLIGGLSPEKCLEIFTANQRNDAGTKSQHLSVAQKQAARELWAAQLAAKAKAVEEKERNRVVVDLDFEEWE